jgi:glycosyltransferase involved in cell wall biosynthesis
VLVSELATGGAERVTTSFLSRLRELGHCVPLGTVTARHDGPLAREIVARGVPRHDLGAARLADPRALYRLLRLLRRQRCNLLHAHGQDAAVLGAVACRLSGTPFVVTRHVLDEPAGDRRQRLRRRAALAACRAARRVVAVSQAAAERLAALARIPPGRITVIPNGVEVARFAGAGQTAAAAALRAEWGVAAGDPLLVVPAVLREGKGHDLLLRALPELERELPALRLVFVGAGELEPRLRRQASELGVRVVFAGERQDMPAVYAAADLVVLPSLAEALPTALIESAAAARPVVATAVGGAVEIVEDGVTGLLVEPGNVAALAAAVRTLLADRDLAARLGRRAREVAASRFTLDLQIERTVAVWHAVTGRAW